MIITCVIGGAGYIGRAVVEELVSRGDRQVVVVGREDSVQHLPAGVRYVQHPPDTTTERLVQTLSAVNEVIDLAYATVPQTSFQNPVNDILVNLPEAVRLFEQPLVKSHHPVHTRGEAFVVGCDERGRTFAADQRDEFGEDLVSGGFVEVAGGFVGEDQRRSVGERAGDRDALLLAARQL